MRPLSFGIAAVSEASAKPCRLSLFAEETPRLYLGNYTSTDSVVKRGEERNRELCSQQSDYSLPRAHCATKPAKDIVRPGSAAHAGVVEAMVDTGEERLVVTRAGRPGAEWLVAHRCHAAEAALRDGEDDIALACDGMADPLRVLAGVGQASGRRARRRPTSHGQPLPSWQHRVHPPPSEPVGLRAWI